MTVTEQKSQFLQVKHLLPRDNSSNSTGCPSLVLTMVHPPPCLLACMDILLSAFYAKALKVSRNQSKHCMNIKLFFSNLPLHFCANPAFYCDPQEEMAAFWPLIASCNSDPCDSTSQQMSYCNPCVYNVLLSLALHAAQDAHRHWRCYCIFPFTCVGFVCPSVTLHPVLSQYIIMPLS